MGASTILVLFGTGLRGSELWGIKMGFEVRNEEKKGSRDSAAERVI
ncbi:MAG: hypothetical protein ACOX3L_01340 [Lutisporaceae bacterium]